MYTVIRVVKYECENEDQMRAQLAGSMPDGIHEKAITITVATYFSDLPPAPIIGGIDNEKLHEALNSVSNIS